MGGWKGWWLEPLIGLAGLLSLLTAVILERLPCQRAYFRYRLIAGHRVMAHRYQVLGHQQSSTETRIKVNICRIFLHFLCRHFDKPMNRKQIDCESVAGTVHAYRLLQHQAV
jgi:hypothetical protein